MQRQHSVRWQVPTASDLTSLPDLTLDNVLQLIEDRYNDGKIYTRCGDVLLSVNPFQPLKIYDKEHHDQYQLDNLHKDMEPHVFQVASQALKRLRDSQRNQVVLVSGESGSGKTENTKYMLQHLVQICGDTQGDLHDKIVQVNPVLEAFGNARTVLNTNSSRFAKYLQLEFTKDMTIQRASIKDYMLEKSRVVHQSPGEGNFHILYSFLAGLSSEDRDTLSINQRNTFRIADVRDRRLTQEDGDMFQEYLKIFNMIQLTEEEIDNVKAILASILHLTNLEFFNDETEDGVQVYDEVPLTLVSDFLQVDTESLAQTLVTKRITVMGEEIETLRSKKNAEGARDALAKALYERLFGWIVRKINESLQPDTEPVTHGHIGILDICGFESLQTNSFEQMLINLVNERIQSYMNDLIFEREKQIYLEQGVDISLNDIEYEQNNHILDMFTGRVGILSLINEDTKLEQASDESMLMKLERYFKSNKHFTTVQNDRDAFVVVHFAGEVRYASHGFLEKNRDILSPEMVSCMKKSSNVMVEDLFTVAKGVTGTISVTNFNYRASRKRDPSRRPPKSGLNLTSSIVSSRRQSMKQRFGGVKKGREKEPKQFQTVIDYFKNSLSDLVKSMEDTDAVFVRCIKPNTRLSPNKFEHKFVESQLKYNGITEVARIRKRLWPIRRSYTEILKRFQILSPKSLSGPSMAKLETAAESILSHIGLKPGLYALGRNLIFMKQEAIETLENALRRKEEEERKRKEEEAKKKAEAERRAKEEAERMRQLEAKAKAKADANNLPRYSDLGGSMSTIIEVSSASVSSGNSFSSASSPVYETLSSDDNKKTREKKEKKTKKKAPQPPTEKNPPNGAKAEPAPDVDAETHGPRVEKNFWDIFRIVDTELPRQEAYNEMTMKIVKVVVYLLLLLFLLASLVGQRVGLMVIVASIPANRTEFDTTMKHYKKGGNMLQYFYLGIVMIIPYILTWLTSFFKWLFGAFPTPGILTWLMVLSLEMFHSFGLSVLVLWVLPKYDMIFGSLLLSATAIMPAILMVTCTSWKISDKSAPKAYIKKFVDFLALICQLSVIPGILYRDWVNTHSKATKHLPSDTLDMVAIAVSFLLPSLKCWENFVDGKCEQLNRDGHTTDQNYNNAFMNKLLNVRYEMQEGRYVINMVSSILKIIVTLAVLYGVMYLQLEPDGVLKSGEQLLTMFDAVSTLYTDLEKAAPMLLVVIACFVAWYVSYIACKLQMQIVSFSIPLLLVVPVTQGLLALNCYLPDGERKNGTTFLDNFIVYNACHDYPPENECAFPYCLHNFFGAVWFLSLMWLCRHIWAPRQGRLEDYDRLFINPFYCGILTFENILLNRRRHKHNVRRELNHYFIVDPSPRFEQIVTTATQEAQAEAQAADIPFVYACATMWHETEVEMTQLMKSIFRLDYDRHIREECAFILGNDKMKDRFNFQAHIFFDDALELNEDDKFQANQFVKTLIDVMSDACSSVHQVYMTIHDPYKVITPYGAQLIWEMPGGSLLYVHVKDKNKIRHRKRWSQVMYMYYLLGYQLLKDSKNDVLSEFNQMNAMSKDDVQKLFSANVQTKTQNTFILALDGDTDFSPGSVRVLLDRMKANELVAAVCGRIHPIGSGPLVWYQMFEYAVGHWLQKATEHVLGCVLCSPGCFSLFRAAALMDNNVMKRYTTFPTQPGHFLQYDQGEDRWLCTLLLQQGYRVDYAAAADAYTYAPEGFNEFFNQRRRWTPSTLANILDLLTTSHITISRNQNISFLYIIYQIAMMFGTVLGPGTVIMMIAGAIDVVFGLGVLWSYAISLVIPIIYTIICFTTPSKIQLYFAAVFSAIYTFIMMAVIAGTLVTAIQVSPLHPSVIFTVLLFGMFALAGILHWKEINCLPHCFLYFICIPSGYLLLFIYSMANLNNVSWGTREIPKRKSKKELAAEKKAAEAKKSEEEKKDGFFARMFFGSSYVKDIKSLIENFKPKLTGSELNENEKLLSLLEKMNANMELLVGKKTEEQTYVKEKHEEEGSEEDEEEDDDITEEEEEDDDDEEEDLDPYRGDHWVTDKRLGSGSVMELCQNEVNFWELFIKKYLKPIDKDEQREKEIKTGLLELRTNICFALIMVNSLWMATNFMFQIKKVASVKIYYEEGGESKEIEIGILGLLFIAFFTILVVIQFFGMLFHRWETLLHLISMTELRSMSTKEQKETMEGEHVLQQLQGVLEPEADYDYDFDEEEIGKRIKEVVETGATARDLAQTRVGGLSKASRRFNNIDLRRTLLTQRNVSVRDNDRMRPDYQERDWDYRRGRSDQRGLRNRFYSPVVDDLIEDAQRRGVRNEFFQRPPRETDTDPDYREIRECMPGYMGRNFARKIRQLRHYEQSARNYGRQNGGFQRLDIEEPGVDYGNTHL